MPSAQGKVDALVKCPFARKRVLPPAVSVRNAPLCGFQRKAKGILRFRLRPCREHQSDAKQRSQQGRRRKRADFFPYLACFMRHSARPLRFVCIPFPLSAVVHCMQAAVQKDPAGLFPCRVLQYCYLRNLKRSRNCFRRLFCAGASAMAGFAGFGAEAGRGSGFLRFTICSSSSK